MKRDGFSLSLPLKSEYLTTVRLTVGGLCALCGMDIDLAEDIKVCVTESLLLLQRNGFSEASLCFCVENGLSVEIEGEASDEAKESAENEISYALLGALCEDVSFTKENGRVVAVALKNGK